MVPLKIALLGAPGSGKGKVARGVARRLNGEVKSWQVVDSYVDKLAKRTGRTFGDVYNRYGFPLNIQVIAERWTQEDEATAKNLNTITCGSIYETIIYGAAQSIPITRAPDEQWMLEESEIAQIMAASFSTLAYIRFDYDALFFLPLDDANEDWAGVIDAKLGEVLEGQGLTALVLDGTHKEKVDCATEAIQTIINIAQEEATKAIESTV